MPVDELNVHVIDWQISKTHIIATYGNINTPEVVKKNVFMNALELVVPEGAPDTEDEEDDTGPRPGDKRKASAGPRHVIRAGDGIRLDTLPGVTKNKSDRCEYKAHDNLQNFNENYPDLMKAHFLELCRRCFDVQKIDPPIIKPLRDDDGTASRTAMVKKIVADIARGAYGDVSSKPMLSKIYSLAEKITERFVDALKIEVSAADFASLEEDSDESGTTYDSAHEELDGSKTISPDPSSLATALPAEFNSCFGSTLWRATVCNDTESIVGALKESGMFKKQMVPPSVYPYYRRLSQKYFDGIGIEHEHTQTKTIIFRQDDTQDWEVLERKDIMIHFKMSPIDTIIGRSQSMLYDALTAIAAAIDAEITRTILVSFVHSGASPGAPTDPKVPADAAVIVDEPQIEEPPQGWINWIKSIFTPTKTENRPSTTTPVNPKNMTCFTPKISNDIDMGKEGRIWDGITTQPIRNKKVVEQDETTLTNIPPITNEELEAIKRQLQNDRSQYADGTKWSTVVSPNSIMTEVSKLGLLTPIELKQVVYACFKDVLDPRSSLDLSVTTLVQYANLIVNEIMSNINPARIRVQAELARIESTKRQIVYETTPEIKFFAVDKTHLIIHVDGFHYGDRDGKTCGGALYEPDDRPNRFPSLRRNYPTEQNTYTLCKNQLTAHNFIDVTNSDFYRMLVPSHDKTRKEDTADMLSPCYATITGPSDTNIPTVCVIENYFRHTDDFLVTESCAMAMLSRVKGGVNAKRVLKHYIHRHNVEGFKILSKNTDFDHIHQRDAAAFFIACGRAITKLSGDYTRWKSSTKVEKDAMEQLKYDTMCTFVLGAMDLKI